MSKRSKRRKKRRKAKDKEYIPRQITRGNVTMLLPRDPEMAGLFHAIMSYKVPPCKEPNYDRCRTCQGAGKVSFGRECTECYGDGYTVTWSETHFEWDHKPRYPHLRHPLDPDSKWPEDRDPCLTCKGKGVWKDWLFRERYCEACGMSGFE